MYAYIDIYISYTIHRSLCVYTYHTVYIPDAPYTIAHTKTRYYLYTSSTAQGGGGSFKNRKPL